MKTTETWVDTAEIGCMVLLGILGAGMTLGLGFLAWVFFIAQCVKMATYLGWLP